MSEINYMYVCTCMYIFSSQRLSITVSKSFDQLMNRPVECGRSSCRCGVVSGWTALHEACNHGWVDVARQLLNAGANVNVRGLENDTPLHDAAINGHTKVLYWNCSLFLVLTSVSQVPQSRLA